MVGDSLDDAQEVVGVVPESRRARQQHFTRLRLRLGFLEEVEIGGRTVEAFKLEVRGQFRDAYVDHLGRVVLLEHDAYNRGKLRHIRILWPSEY